MHMMSSAICVINAILSPTALLKTEQVYGASYNFSNLWKNIFIEEYIALTWKKVKNISTKSIASNSLLVSLFA